MHFKNTKTGRKTGQTPMQVIPIILLICSTTSAFSAWTKPPIRRRTLMSALYGGRGGGRAPGTLDKIDASESWEVSPTKPSEARLIVIQVTDVYTLENFASLKTMVEETRKNSNGSKVVCMLTGDFLSPYLLSSIDQGAGMMRALSKVPIDYLTWGNHEADIKHKVVCKHVRNFPGTWINSNMLDHEAMESQKEFDVIELCSPDGSNSRKVGLVAVLSDDPKLYEHFAPPGAFGGATITDPWEALKKYKALLEGPTYNCDVILPLQHLYVQDDYKTCEMFDFPVVLSGHDHHRVDDVRCGTRLLKPGMNAVYATVLEISWESANTGKAPKIRARFVPTMDWTPDPILARECERAYDALAPLRNTELARIPSTFEPLSSSGSREKVCTMGKYICTLIRSSLNVTRRQRRHRVDAVLLMGGNIRGNADYPPNSYFSLEALEAEIKSDETIGVVQIPGWLLAEGIQATHAGDPIPGWMQYDNGIVENYEVSPPVITHVAGEPIQLDKTYRVATKIGDLTNGQSPPLAEYFLDHPEALPPKGAYVNIHAELMGYFARNLWRKLWDATTERIDPAIIHTDEEARERLKILNKSITGVLTVDEIQAALNELLGYSVDDREKTLAEFVHSFADTSGDGTVSLLDMEVFCEEMAELYERDRWRLAFGRTSAPNLDALSKVERQTTF